MEKTTIETGILCLRRIFGDSSLCFSAVAVVALFAYKAPVLTAALSRVLSIGSGCCFDRMKLQPEADEDEDMDMDMDMDDSDQEGDDDGGEAPPPLPPGPPPPPQHGEVCSRYRLLLSAAVCGLRELGISMCENTAFCLVQRVVRSWRGHWWAGIMHSVVL